MPVSIQRQYLLYQVCTFPIQLLFIFQQIIINILEVVNINKKLLYKTFNVFKVDIIRNVLNILD